MGICQINHMDVISDATSIWGIVIVTENCQLLSNACGSLGEERNQVLRSTHRQFPNFCTWVCSYWIEVTQRYYANAWLALHIIHQNIFPNLFGIAVGTFGIFARGSFGHWQDIGLAVDCTGGREYDILNPLFLHEFKQDEQGA